jgi:hypothetical protein
MFNGGYCNPDIGVEVEQVKGTWKYNNSTFDR